MLSFEILLPDPWLLLVHSVSVESLLEAGEDYIYSLSMVTTVLICALGGS